MKAIRLVAFVILVFLAFVSSVLAQTSQGRISGRVSDQSGAVISGATVTILNSETGIRRVLTTNAAGEYFAPNLNPGVYLIMVEAPSFKRSQRSAFRLEVATDVRQDFTLQPGAATETVNVTAEQPLVDSVTDVLGGTLTNKLINELPLQGRDFQNLLELRPGIQRVPGGGFMHTTSNGNRREDNNYIVDGTDDNDIYYGDTVINGAGVAGTPASHLPLDAIQEFNTQENQGAEYGWKPGAVVNIGLKSGGNVFHGTSYYFHRNSAFDARNFFNPGPQPVAALLLHQFGASAGGPIVKDKWFIFGNYEGVRHKVGNPGATSSPVTVPGVDDPTISLPAAKADLGCPANCSDLSLHLADLFLPNTGNNGLATPDQINFDFNNTNREDNFIIKSDYHPNSKHVITGRYFFTDSYLAEEDTIAIRPDWLSVARTKIGVTGVNWTWIPNARWVNEARFGYSRNWQNDNVVDYQKSALSYGINTGVTDPHLFGFPQINVGNFDSMGGNRRWPLYTAPNTTWEWVDNASVTFGSHNLKFGGEFRYGGTDNLRANYGRGSITFDTLEDFLLGHVESTRGRILTGDTHRHATMSGFGGFVEDAWRVRPRLSVNLGLRYDVTLPVKEEHDLIANFIPSRGGIVQVGRGIDSPYNTDWNNISPRLGIAWDVFGTGKTVLRTGGAIIYEQPTIRQYIDTGGLNENPSGATFIDLDGNAVQGNGNIQVVQRRVSTSALTAAWANGTPLFDTTPSITCEYDSPCDVFGIKQNIATPYVASWNFNLQQAITPTTALQVAYVANRGTKLYSLRDINQNIPALDNEEDEQSGRPFVQNCPTPPGSGLGGPCLPWVGYAYFMENKANSIYNALQVTLTQKSFRGLNLLAGYTWAHAIDIGATNNRSAYAQDSNNFQGDRGNGDYDIRHRFTLSLSYDLPHFKAPLQMGQGWQVTSIVNLQTGEPYNYYDSTDDISGTGWQLDRWNFYGNPSDVHWGLTQQATYVYPGTSDPRCAAHGSAGQLDYYGCLVAGNSVITPPEPGQFGNMGRNIFTGPTFKNWDMSVTKLWKLSERVNLQARGEFFNILNHTNFDWLTLTTDLSDPVFGSNDLGIVRFTPDVGASNPVIGSGGSRHIQLGVKVIW
jgi:hypothetical protein